MTTTLEALVKKKLDMQQQPDHYMVSVSDLELEVQPFTDDEVLELAYGSAAQAQAGDGAAALRTVWESMKQLLYTHCGLLQQYAAQEPPKGEPWDVVDELFTLPERNELYGQLMGQCGYIDFLNNKAKNA